MIRPLFIAFAVAVTLMWLSYTFGGSDIRIQPETSIYPITNPTNTQENP